MTSKSFDYRRRCFALRRLGPLSSISVPDRGLTIVRGITFFYRRRPYNNFRSSPGAHVPVYVTMTAAAAVNVKIIARVRRAYTSTARRNTLCRYTGRVGGRELLLPPSPMDARGGGVVDQHGSIDGGVRRRRRMPRRAPFVRRTRLLSCGAGGDDGGAARLVCDGGAFFVAVVVAERTSARARARGAGTGRPGARSCFDDAEFGARRPNPTPPSDVI